MYPKHSVMKGLHYFNGNIKIVAFISDKEVYIYHMTLCLGVI